MNQEAVGRLGRLLQNESDMAFKRRAPLLLEYLELRPADRVLDCGCGMGFYLKALGVLGQFARFGLDSDTQPLRFARRELKDHPALVQGDILALPYADNSFDKIIMAEVLEHLEMRLGIWDLSEDGVGTREVLESARFRDKTFCKPRTMCLAGCWSVDSPSEA